VRDEVEEPTWRIKELDGKEAVVSLVTFSEMEKLAC